MNTNKPDKFCLKCGTLLDAHSIIGKEQHQPRPHVDICLCYKCGHPHKLDDDYNVIPLSEEDEEMLASDERIAKMSEVIRRENAKRLPLQ